MKTNYVYVTPRREMEMVHLTMDLADATLFAFGKSRDKRGPTFTVCADFNTIGRIYLN